MARQIQETQVPTKQTIISPPRSSRSPSISFVPQQSKSQPIPKRRISTLSQFTSPRNSPPPDFLLDDDPFANLTGFGGVCRQLSAKATGGDVKHSTRSLLVNNDNAPPPAAKRPSTSNSTQSASPTNFSAFRAMGMRSSFPSIASLTTQPQPANPPAIPQAQPQPQLQPQPQPQLQPQPQPQPQPQLQPQPQPQPQSQPQPQPQPQPQLQPQPQPHRPHNSPPTTSRPLHQSSLSSSSSLPLPHRPCPAHQRPAFKSRPSLPSLNTLAKMNFAGFGVKKVRKGKVGAGLPYEPWNNLGSRPSSGETSSVEEEDESVVVPAPPLPSLISVIESASTSDRELGDSKISSRPFPPRSSSFSIPPSSFRTSHTGTPSIIKSASASELGDSKTSTPPLPRSSSFSIPPSSSSTSSSHSGTVMPPRSVSPTSFGLDKEVGIVYGNSDRSGKLRSPPRSPPAGPTAAPKVSLTSSSTSSSHTGTDMPLALSSFELDAEAGVYGSCDRSGKSRSPPRSPPTATAAPQVSLPSSHTGADMSPHSVSVGPASLGLDAEVGVYGSCDRSAKSRSPPRSPPTAAAAPQVSLPSSSSHTGADMSPHSVSVGPTSLGLDVEDDEGDQFMDQFMEHYDRLDREEDQRASRRVQGPSQEEDNDVIVSLRERVVVVEGGDGIQKPLPPRPSSLLATGLAIPSIDTASVSSSETLIAFPRTSSPILASDDSSPFNPYSYTYPYPSSRQNGGNGVVAPLGNVDESGEEIQMPPRLWSSTSLLAARAIPLVDTASVSSSETLRTSATLTAFSRSSSPILASPFDEKGRMRTAGLEIGGRIDLSTFLAISSGSSTSSSNEDDEDHYGPVNSSPSQTQAVVNANLRTHHSRAASSISTFSPGYITPPPRTLSVSRNNGSRFSESEDDDDDVDEDDNEEDEDDDDDVPLAQRIPGALTAQKSIRRQVRQEREKRKQEKALRNHAETTRMRLMTLRPGAVPSSSHDTASALAASQTAMQRNSRSLTRNGSISLSREDSVRRRDINGPDGVDAATTPVDATSLYQRLQSLHHSKSAARSLKDVRPPSTETLPPVPNLQNRPSGSQNQRAKSLKELPSAPYQFPTSPSPTPINSAYAPSSMTPLRPVRSFHFHRPSIDRRPIGMDDPSSVPLPLDAEKRISQNLTNIARSRPPTREGPQQQPYIFPTTAPTHHHRRSLSRSRGSSERASATIPESVPVPPIPSTGRISHGSTDTKAPSRQHRPAPSVSTPVDHLPMIKPELVVQQRVFIGNMQRFNMVEISSSTTAGDIIEMVRAEGTFKEFAGSEGWMVFEVAQDFGMERPIRSFELVTDVQASWNKDKMVNYLVLRMTPLEVPLNRSAIPSSSPTHSGYVEWEAKRGKWSKRFMQLREHSIWISKRESGQDQVHLCSLSNFDAYRVTRTHRAPKPFAFAVKSTDNLSFFENTADYLHSFSCSEKEGKIWMEKILVARSYVLFQERHVLFNPKAAVGNTSGVSRSATRKVTTPMIQRPHHDIFEPGSLLSKQL